MSRFRKGKKAARKFDFFLEWCGIRDHSPTSPRQRKFIDRFVKFQNNKNSIHIVGDWIDDLIWCPSQCYLKITFRKRWFIIYLRWRHSDPWRAYLCETSVGSHDPYGPPGWDMHDDKFDWLPIPVADFRDSQLDELKADVMKKTKSLLLNI